jgi:hypothetical protein
MNEHEIIVFSDYKIYCLPEDCSDTESVEEDYEDFELDDDQDDIYSDEHPWDTRSYTGYRFRPDIVYFGQIFSE